MPVGDLVDLALTPPLNAVEAAIKQQDAQKFAAAYDQVTQGCNACHMELDHPYRRDQNARCVGVSEPGIQGAAVGGLRT